MLTFGPLAPTLAAGNTAVIKPSELCIATSALIGELVPKYFDPKIVAVVQGAVPETTALLEQNWDLIFFTGSPQVGKIIHQAAAKSLTPAVLELGGKNPTIVHSSADIKTAARRIAHGRYVNSGQICTAPDHVLVWPDVKDELVSHLAQTVREFYGDDPQTSPDYGRIINRKSTERLAGLLESGKAVVGGNADLDDCYIAPTVLVDVAWDSPIMKEEIFGPILPVLEVDSVEDVIKWVNGNPAPLGLYIFADDEDVVEDILVRTSSGDAVVNDCSLHPLIPELPFGGVGNSGMGKYHGRWGFEAFTNAAAFCTTARRSIPACGTHRSPSTASNVRSRTSCHERAVGGHRRRRLCRRRVREAPRQTRLLRHADRQEQLPPVPAAPLSGRDRGAGDERHHSTVAAPSSRSTTTCTCTGPR